MMNSSKKQVPEWLNSSLWSSKPTSPSALSTPLSTRSQGKGTQSPKSEGNERISEGKGTQSPKSEGNERISEGKGTQSPISEDNERIGEGKGLQAGSDEQKDDEDSDTKQENVRDEAHTEDVEEDEESDWCPQPLDSSLSLPSIPGHSTPPRFSQTSFKRSSSFDTRVGQFRMELSRKTISIPELQRLASQGIPDCGSIRARTWKLLLGYLPRNQDLWVNHLATKHAEYSVFCKELLVTPSEVTRIKEAEALDRFKFDARGVLPRQEITHEDHPLSLGKTSVWHQFFLDSELCEQIDRDVKRTHPDMQFFCGDSAASVENQEAMKRALFIFAKLNPGIRYVQGMNEILAPLFYVFKTDPDESDAAHAEADSFFCFVELLSDFRDHFCQQLDNSAVGIRSTIAHLMTLLKRQDEELWRHLEVVSKVNPQFYAFRWITLLLTQEFNFPDCLRLWDSILSNGDGPLEILLRICCAMLISMRSRILAGDFTSNLKLLQHYPSMDVHHLLQLADELKFRNLE